MTSAIMRRFSCFLLVLLLADSLHSFQSPVVPGCRAPKSTLTRTQLYSVDEFFRSMDPTLGLSLAFVGVTGTAFWNRARQGDAKTKSLLVRVDEPGMPETMEQETVLKDAVMYNTDTLDVAASPTVESPTQHFSKGFADSTPYSQAGPPQKGRSDVSHLDRMEGDAGNDAYMDSMEKIDSPTVKSPTQFFEKGFADSTPYSQAGPPQKGRSDVSHMDRMEGDAAYLDSYKSPVGRDRLIKDPLVESEDINTLEMQNDPVETINFEVQKNAVEANVEEPPVKTDEKNEKAYTLQEQKDLVEAAIDETVLESEEVHNLEVQKDPGEATTVIEELPVVSKEESDKPPSSFQFKSSNDEEVEASPNKKKPSAAVFYLDPLVKAPEEETVTGDSPELLSFPETTQATVQDAPKEPPASADFLKPSKDASEDVATTVEVAPVEVVATQQISVMDLKDDGVTDAPLIEKPPVRSPEKTREPSLFSYLKSPKGGSYEDMVAIVQEPPAEAAAMQKVLDQALKDDGTLDSLHEYIQDLARAETRKRMNQKKGRLASREATKVVDETPSKDSTGSETTTPTTKTKTLPEFLANNGFDETKIVSSEKDEPETEIESAEKVKIVVEKVKTPERVKSMAKPIKENQLRRLVRPLSENKGPIFLVALAFVISKQLLGTLIGRGML